MFNIKIDYTLYAQWLILALQKEWDPIFTFLEKNPKFVFDIVGVRLKEPNPTWNFLEIAFLQGNKEVITRFQALFKPYCIGVYTKNDEVIQEIIVSFDKDYINWLIENDCIHTSHVGPTGQTLMEYLQIKQRAEDKLEVARVFSRSPIPVLHSQVNWGLFRRAKSDGWPSDPMLQKPNTPPSASPTKIDNNNSTASKY